MSPTTFAAPLMSCFMSPMPAAGLMLMPPVSNVIPLPTKTSFRFAPLGVYDRCTKRGSRALPAAHRVDELHPAPADLLEVEDLHVQAVLLGELLGGRGEASPGR